MWTRKLSPVKAKTNTVYTYDNIGNLTKVDYPVSHDVTLSYDAMNRLTNMVDAAGTSAFTYYAGGLLATEDGPFSNDTVTNVYSNRLRTGLTLQQPTGTWTNGFTWDSAHRLSTVTSPAGTFTYTYQTPGTLVKKLALPNTSYITNTFDSVARLTGTYLDNSSNTILDKDEYLYNLGNQRIRDTRTDGSYYTNNYDNIGQLVWADSTVAAEDRGYLYDAAWNINTRTNNGVTTTFSVDSKNQLTSGPGGSCTYDSNGNLKSSHGGPWTYTYDDENQMTNVNSSATWRSDLVYDGLQRLRKRLEYTWTSSGGTNGSWSLSSTTLYIYDGMRVIQERSSTTTPSVSYTRGADLSGSLEGAGGIGGLLSRSHAYQSGSGSFTNHNYYHADGNGNITYMVDTNQSMVATYRYDPFGNSISSSGTLASANVYRFSSKERHNNSGMYYYGYRWYDPNLQRWLNRDPIQEEGGINLYGFVRNSPFSVVDAEGLRWFSYFPVLNVLNCFLAEPGEKPGDYNSIPPPSCDKCKEDAELAEDECKRAVARKEAQNIGNVMGPMIVSGVGDLILGGISIAVPPVWIGTGIGVIGTACEVKAMMNIDKAAKQYSDKNCKCPK